MADIPGVDQDGFQALLERIRQGQTPKFGSLSWDGQDREITETVQFESNGAVEDDAVVRDRALRYLESLTPEELEAVDVVFREGRPVRAQVRAKTSELSPARLLELRTRAGIK